VNVRSAPLRARLPVPFLWTITGVATIAACALYGVQIAAGVELRNQLQRTCHSHRAPELAQYFSATMMLAAMGAVAGVAAVSATSRPLTRFATAIPVLACCARFLLSWYGFTTRDDEIGPLCSNL